MNNLLYTLETCPFQESVPKDVFVLSTLFMTHLVLYLREVCPGTLFFVLGVSEYMECTDPGYVLLFWAQGQTKLIGKITCLAGLF